MSQSRVRFLQARPLIHFGWTLRSFGDAARHLPAGQPRPEFVQKISRELSVDPSKVVWMDQVHGSHVRVIRAAPLSGVLETTDACVTSAPGIALCVRMADCLPVLMFDASGGAVAAVHAGWKGLLAGIVLDGLKTLCRLVCISPDRVSVAFGPSIEQACYEVGEDIRGQFMKAYGIGAARFFKSSGEGFRLSLMGLAIWQLEMAGVPVASVRPDTSCTACMADELYSFRARREEGRIAAFIYKDDAPPAAGAVRRILK